MEDLTIDYIKQRASEISLEVYNYPLPQEAIAKYPLVERDQCRLLSFDATNGCLEDHRFADVASLLPAGSLLVRNNSRVLPARLFMTRETGATLEIFCLKPLSPASYSDSLSSTGSVTWECLIGNARRWKESSERLVREIKLSGDKVISLYAQRSETNPTHITFSHTDSSVSFAEILECVGTLPIPPYLGRDTESSDAKDYQTIYATQLGSVAAPTAGLHFTEAVDEAIVQKGIPIHEVTLHVGAGTFLPIKGDAVATHKMHSELCSVERTTIEGILRHREPIVAVGTTTVRTLESLYYLAQNHLEEITSRDSDIASVPHISQWEAYLGDSENAFSLLETLLERMYQLQLQQVHFTTALFIFPSYRFHYVRQLITNFHQPKSTLLLMISAFIGDAWERLYQHALDTGYRFLSYGDACLLKRNDHIAK